MRYRPPRLLLCCLSLTLLVAGCASSRPERAVHERRLEAYRKTILTLADPLMEGRGIGTRGLDMACDWIAQRFVSVGLGPGYRDELGPTYLQSFEVYHEGANHRVRNVVGVVPGRGGLAGQIVVIGAHYDHLGYGKRGSHLLEARGQVHPGANDNASGVAALLLVAEDLLRLGREQPDTPRRTAVIVAFTAEEFGVHGSYNLQLHRDKLNVPGSSPGHNIVAMINLDMVGSLRDQPLNVFGTDSGDQWRAALQAAKKQTDLDYQTFGEAEGLSDHVTFLRQRIPAVLLITQLDDTYHTPRDVPMWIDTAGGVRVAAFAAALADRLMTEPEPIRWTGGEMTLPEPGAENDLSTVPGELLEEDGVGER